MSVSVEDDGVDRPLVSRLVVRVRTPLTMVLLHSWVDLRKTQT